MQGALGGAENGGSGHSYLAPVLSAPQVGIPLAPHNGGQAGADGPGELGGLCWDQLVNGGLGTGQATPAAPAPPAQMPLGGMFEYFKL